MAKVTSNLSKANALIPKLKAAVLQVASEDLKLAIIDNSILLGISPVKQTNPKFVKYSDSYKKAIRDGRYKEFGKTISPVNLKLSGQMLDSFTVTKKGDGLNIAFNHELAEIHTVRGASIKKVKRKMLPVLKGEEFRPAIQKVILDLVRKAIDRILGK